MNFAEYIWLDGGVPTQGLRSKTRLVTVNSDDPKPEDFPRWNFDGSSTEQADGSSSDCLLNPVNVVRDPIRGMGHFLVLCEVCDENVTPHSSNARAKLRAIMEAGASDHEPWIGFEQEYTLFRDGRPLGFPSTGYPAPQGPYYCSVGSDNAFGRSIAEAHMIACVEAGIIYHGANAEVMPGQWEFQVGYRGRDTDDPRLVNVCDHLWIARWLLHRIAEREGVSVSFDAKPVKGDWNGAGMHTNFSTAATRNAESGIDAIHQAIARLSRKHAEHIALYGTGLEDRLTGLHETCPIHEFRSGASDRGASIRIPRPVEKAGHGYFEDRRPGANANPYLVSARLAATVCDVEDAALTVVGAPANSNRELAA